MPIRVVPFVDHEIGYRLLKKLIKYNNTGRLELPAVVTTCANKKSWWPSVEPICKEAGIPIIRYEDAASHIGSLTNIDWYLLLSWKYILPKELIKGPKNGVVNLHYSLLPKYRGVYPANWAIINGESTTGISYHIATNAIDQGATLIQVEVPILLSDTARSLQKRLDNAAYKSFDSLLVKISHDNQRKEELLCSRPKLKEKEYFSRKDFENRCEIDLEKGYKGLELFNLIRGLTFLPNSKNAYIIDKHTNKKLYLSIKIIED